MHCGHCSSLRGITLLALVALLNRVDVAAAAEVLAIRTGANGPLRVDPENTRYFTDGSRTANGSLRVVYLSGSHNWYNFQDAGRLGMPLTKKFDFDEYLKLLLQFDHNFIRLWAWEGAGYWWQGEVNDEYYEPLAYRRTGPGKAADGKAKFDLNQFDPEYFDRLRSRVIAARDRGIYVSVMLFQGWSIYSHGYGNPWPLHPYNIANNINGIDGDTDNDGEGKEVHSLNLPAVTRIQEAYVRKVVDTVNDLDNVLYEVTNQTANHSKDWQYHIVRYAKDYESKKPKQHPVGITYFDSGPPGTMDVLLESPADWISPGDDGGKYDYQGDPPVANGRKVSVLDTDHIFGVGGDDAWVWKSFMRGHNPIYMDPLHNKEGFNVTETKLDDARKAMGQSRRYAERINLAAMTPQNELSTTNYCLAEPGKEYLVYQPRDGAFTIELIGDVYAVEWLNLATGVSAVAIDIKGGGPREFNAPFEGSALLHLKARATKK